MNGVNRTCNRMLLGASGVFVADSRRAMDVQRHLRRHDQSSRRPRVVARSGERDGGGGESWAFDSVPCVDGAVFSARHAVPRSSHAVARACRAASRAFGASSHACRAASHASGASSHGCRAASHAFGALSHGSRAASHAFGAVSRACGAVSRACGAASHGAGAATLRLNVSFLGRLGPPGTGETAKPSVPPDATLSIRCEGRRRTERTGCAEPHPVARHMDSRRARACGDSCPSTPLTAPRGACGAGRRGARRTSGRCRRS